MPRPQATLLALLYSLMAQLTRLLPSEFEPSPSPGPSDLLTEESLALLDGTPQSIPLALQTIAALLSHAPPSLVWVIDGLQMAESQETREHLEGFLGILRGEEREGKRVSKVCFTTDGNSAVLGRGLRVDKKVDAARLVQGRGLGGRVLKGGGGVGGLR